MSKHKLLIVVVLLSLAGLLMTACGGPATPEGPRYSNTATPEGGAVATAPATQVELHFAIITDLPEDSPALAAVIEAMERTQVERPKGLDIYFDLTTDVAPEDAEAILRELAETEVYEIIWSIGDFADAVSVMHGEFRNLLWAYSGENYEPVGDNAYWIDTLDYEAAYLAGLAAGSLTESNVIGAVLAADSADAVVLADAYLAGAQSVNTDVTLEASYAVEADAEAAAQSVIDAGADVVFTEYAAAAAAGDAAGAWVLGQNAGDFDAMAANAVPLWDPAINRLINAWNNASDFSPYSAPLERIIYNMADGGSDLVTTDLLPAEVLDAVNSARQEIIDGTLVVPSGTDE